MAYYNQEKEMTLNEYTVTVIYFVEPEEKQTLDYPGYPLTVTIEDIIYNSISIFKVVNENDIDKLETELYNEIKDGYNC